MNKLKYSMEFEKEKIIKEEKVVKEKKRSYSPSLIEIIMFGSLFVGVLSGSFKYISDEIDIRQGKNKEKKELIENIKKMNVFENFEDIN
jgi:hypothetical protein